MTFVKADVPADEQHVAMELGLLFDQIRQVLGNEEWGGLRPSHLRVMGFVPPAGTSITELAVQVGMTKQGCGQFVSQLVDTGHLVVEPDPDDGRVRLVRRTPAGDSATRHLAARLAQVERGWAAQVGDRRYRTFRRVLDELAHGRA
ncbi:MarR family winged helix-turn-helix transcriptional regulator [Nocardioides sp.]|uniref:MarR family winged helix-turn-helix transcriptional regulator n=1 Tax=Nocardioides sp. TaxID=35761 RepID=UPI0031FE52F8|nr:MarR family transcriptional regulator [Nocardioides sp.]